MNNQYNIYGGKTSKEIETIRARFQQFDRDGSGAISRTEIQSLLTQLDIPLTSGELDDFFIMLDKDGSGYIDEQEFVLHFSIRARDCKVCILREMRGSLSIFL